MLLIISLIIVALFIYFLKGSLKKHAGIYYIGAAVISIAVFLLEFLPMPLFVKNNILGTDGAFAQAVTHPSGGISKLYRVTVQPRADEAQIIKMSSGVVLDDGTKTLPCAINVVTDEPGCTVMEMTLKEGKNREIRRMCEAVGLEVVRLKRNAEGVVKLGMLKPGTYRELTKAEINGLRSAAAKGRAQTRSAALQSKAAERRPRGPVGKSAPKKRK